MGIESVSRKVFATFERAAKFSSNVIKACRWEPLSPATKYKIKVQTFHFFWTLEMRHFLAKSDTESRRRMYNKIFLEKVYLEIDNQLSLKENVVDFGILPNVKRLIEPRMIDQFGRKRCQKKHKDVIYYTFSLVFFSKTFTCTWAIGCRNFFQY